VLFSLSASLVTAQQKPATEGPEVVRISIDLVQTGVTVFDKQGQFVDGLTPEQFELRLDGNPVKLAFFDRVTAGTSTEDRRVVEASRGSAASTSAVPAAMQYRGRTIIFFVDDMHLSAQSIGRTRKMVNDFIDQHMDPDDQVAIGSPTGQIGFLSRLTNVKPVIRAAIARVHHRPFSVNDAENIKMTEYQALRVDQGDRDTTNHFVTEMMKASSYKIPAGGSLGPPQGGPVNRPQDRSQQRQGGITAELAERSVKNRAQSMLRQSSAISINTLESLESTIRASSQILGRKLVFFVSDGFYLNDRNTGFGDKLKQITDAAVRSGVVVYTIDARGLVGTTDASSNRADPFGNLSRANVGELSASQDPLTALAADTGGRALLNSEMLSRAVTDALKETANYYLLAWRPPAETQKGGNFRRLEVRIAGRPELRVRMPRGFVTGEPKAVVESNQTIPAALPASSAPAAAQGVEADLRAALLASSQKKALPTQLYTTFIDVPNTGAVLNASLQIATEALDFGADGKQPAAIDIGGVVYNDQGKPAGSFKNRINVNPRPVGEGPVTNAGVVYSHKLPLKPGIYQVRVATRDDRSRRIGSDSNWIEIPDLTSKKITLSSLLIGGQFVGSSSKQTTSGDSEDQMQFSVDRRFTRGSHLSLLTFIYNAAAGGGGTGGPDLDTQIKILRGGQAIISSPVRKLVLEAGGDPARIPYGADIKLNTLAPGRYLLHVEVNDRLAKTRASQEIVFEVE